MQYAQANSYIPENTTRSFDVGFTLGQRRRRWVDVNPTLDQRLMFAVIVMALRIKYID